MTYDESNALAIISFLKLHDFTNEAIASVLANLYAESSLRSNNAQNSYMTKFGTTDEHYTKAVDDGYWKRPDNNAPFIADSIGYGLCQWTSSGRKTGLYDFAKKLNVSISNINMQLSYLLLELQESYKKVYENLLISKDVRSSTILFMTDYERPAKKDDPYAQETRVKYALEFFKLYFGGEPVMTNSSLVNYTKISPNKTVNRNHVIDTVTIHCVVGQTSVERLGEIFAPTSKKASSNYGIGPDGRIGLYVEEKDRSWCSSNAENDNRAVTIEVASDSFAPYKITDKAYNALIELLIDICKRNNIRELKWKGDKNLIGQVDKQNMTVHRWFAKKSCPGDYLYNLHSKIANDVNAVLTGDKPGEKITTVVKHTVVKGDTLSSISYKYNASIRDIINANTIITNKNVIVVGWVLDIPITSNIPLTYTVISGDTLTKIAKKIGYGCTWQELAKVNGIKAPYIIRKGQVLKVPDLAG